MTLEITGPAVSQFEFRLRVVFRQPGVGLEGVDIGHSTNARAGLPRHVSDHELPFARIVPRLGQGVNLRHTSGNQRAMGASHDP